MTQVKICGIKTREALELLAELRTDYVGFVFAPSKRQISGAEAGRLLAAVDRPPVPVGVFVNPTIAELDSILEVAPLQVIQLHGTESPAFCAEAGERFGIQVWKAISIGKPDFTISSLAAYQPYVDAFLFDTYHPAMAGGSGKAFDWSAIPALQQQIAPSLGIVAGGIDRNNVAELLNRYAPAALDVSSGVETEGAKDLEKIKSFMKKVRDHDAATHPC